MLCDAFGWFYHAIIILLQMVLSVNNCFRLLIESCVHHLGKTCPMHLSKKVMFLREQQAYNPHTLRDLQSQELAWCENARFCCNSADTHQLEIPRHKTCISCTVAREKEWAKYAYKYRDNVVFKCFRCRYYEIARKTCVSNQPVFEQMMESKEPEVCITCRT